LAIDRLNESLVTYGQPAVIAKAPLDELFNAAKPPESFDSAATEEFVQKLDRVAKSFHDSGPGR
jgi:hypothetical protein